MKPLFCFVGILIPIFSLQAQVVEDNFDDLNINFSPQWIGDTSAFIVNDSFELQLNDTAEETSSKYLSTIFESTNLFENEWRFDLKLDFSPSNSNKLKYFLASNNSALKDDSTQQETYKAYYVEVGETGSNDAISLFVQEGEESKLIARGTEGQFSSAFAYAIQVILEDGENWTIGVSELGMINYEQTAAGKSPVDFKPSSLGLKCFYTASRSKLFYFDNIYFGPVIRDTIPPSLLNAEVYNQQSIKLSFTKPIYSVYPNETDHFLLEPDNTRPEVLRIVEDSVFLSFSDEFVNGTTYQLLMEGLVDELGNEMLPTDFRFTYILPEHAESRDLIISEFLADPSPSNGLPESEFIEIYNRSNKYIDISNYLLKDQSTTVGKLPKFLIAPDSFLILCPANYVSSYQKYGSAVSPTKWPSLNNGSDSLFLLTADSMRIDELYYDSDFYNEDTGGGGFSLEIINRAFSCFHQSNWASSMEETGGTPGRINSINDDNAAGPVPSLDFFTLINEQEINLQFDMPIKVDPDKVIKVIINGEEVLTSYELRDQQLLLVLEHPLMSNTAYELILEGIMSCNGAVLENFNYNFVFDLSAPLPSSITFVTDSSFLLSFNEVIVFDEMELMNYFTITEEISISNISQHPNQTFLITINERFQEGNSYELTVTGITDVYGNTTVQESYIFAFNSPQQIGKRDLLITELMVKPLSDQILPDTEYVEIYNTTEHELPLYKVHISDLRDTAIIPLTIMSPNEYIILCPKSKVYLFDEEVRTIGISPWPNLNNAADELSILNHERYVISGIAYDDSWYRDTDKEAEGGWSLEIMDVMNPCAGKPNWRASTAQQRGTPSAINAVREVYPDSFGPELLTVMAIDKNSVLMQFNETLLEQQLNPAFIEITPAKKIKEVVVKSSTTLMVLLQEPLIERVVYQVKVQNLMDCVGNLVDENSNTATFAVVEKALPNDVIINEILFDPVSGGVDFIELYNNSTKYINLSHWQLLVNEKRIDLFTEKAQLIAPKHFLALTDNKEQLINNYPISANGDFIISQPIPNFPNEGAVISLMDADSIIHQSLTYSEDMHLSFLKNTEGVSLERISPDAEISTPASWSSASSQVGYATPGSKNSQLKQAFNSFGILTIDPPSFSPYLSGRNYTLIYYEAADIGSIGSLKIYNKSGQLIKTLANNESLNTNGFYRWDGDGDNGMIVSTGYYIVYFSIFDQQGNTKNIVKKVAVAAY